MAKNNKLFTSSSISNDPSADFSVIGTVDEYELFLNKYMGCSHENFDPNNKSLPVIRSINWRVLETPKPGETNRFPKWRFKVQNDAFKQYVDEGSGMGMIFGKNLRAGYLQNTYVSCPLITIFRYMLKLTDPDDLCLYEMAMNYDQLTNTKRVEEGDKAAPIAPHLRMISGICKWVMDIETYISTNFKIQADEYETSIEKYESFIMTFKEIIKDFAKEFFRLTDEQKDQIYFLEIDSSLLNAKNEDDNKISRHQANVIPGIVFEGLLTIGALNRRFENWLIKNYGEPGSPEAWMFFNKKRDQMIHKTAWFNMVPAFDGTVNTPNRLLRLNYNTKKGKNRHFRHWPLGDDMNLSKRMYGRERTRPGFSAISLILNSANFYNIPSGIVINDETGKIEEYNYPENEAVQLKVIRVWEGGKPYHTMPISTSDEYAHRDGFTHPLALEMKTSVSRKKDKKSSNPFLKPGTEAEETSVVKHYYSSSNVKRFLIDKDPKFYGEEFAGKDYHPLLARGKQWDMEGSGNYQKMWNMGKFNCGKSIRPVFCMSFAEDLFDYLRKRTRQQIYELLAQYLDEDDTIKIHKRIRKAWRTGKKIRPWSDAMTIPFKLNYSDFNAYEFRLVFQLGNNFCPHVWMRSLAEEFEDIGKYTDKHGSQHASIFISLKKRTIEWGCYSNTCRYSPLFKEIPIPQELLDMPCKGTNRKATYGEVMESFAEQYYDHCSIDPTAVTKSLVYQLLKIVPLSKKRINKLLEK